MKKAEDASILKEIQKYVEWQAEGGVYPTDRENFQRILIITAVVIC